MRKLSRRKVAVTSMVIAVVLLIALFSVASLAAENNGASVSKETDSCTVVDEFGNLEDITGTVKLITTQSTNDNQTYQCEIKDFGNDTGSAVNWSFGDVTTIDGNEVILNLRCMAPDTGKLTAQWDETISASGSLKLTCQFN